MSWPRVALKAKADSCRHRPARPSLLRARQLVPARCMPLSASRASAAEQQAELGIRENREATGLAPRCAARPTEEAASSTIAVDRHTQRFHNDSRALPE
eukprot:CAMPEP_0197935180 /NCGR_PEP_ID=MMETSP1439-20131203/112901_1 /TAXON_ID=66791 /ORGANISM="Gonyaulax spinifera, Strain CCMP409" /LENGTH=98 /DNA_ID=CAMNT_0043558103 /DNA_START=39 /DNA_END=332 /DNA_ORIENTATION=+